MKITGWIITAVITLTILIGGVFLYSKQPNTETINLPQPTSYEYYWSVTCPYCKNVNDFLESWENKDKITLEKFETASNKTRFLTRGEFCNIPRRQLGVPLLITPEGICLTGDKPIIDHFKGLEFEAGDENSVEKE